MKKYLFLIIFIITPLHAQSVSNTNDTQTTNINNITISNTNDTQISNTKDTQTTDTNNITISTTNDTQISNINNTKTPNTKDTQTTNTNTTKTSTTNDTQISNTNSTTISNTNNTNTTKTSTTNDTQISNTNSTTISNTKDTQTTNTNTTKTSTTNDTQITNINTILEQFNSFYKTNPYVSIFTKINSVSTLPNGGSPNVTTPNICLVIANRVPLNNKLYLYTQFRTSFFVGSTSFPSFFILPIIHLENTKVGGLIGFGGIVKDWRVGNKGWNISVNGGFVIEGGVSNRFTRLTIPIQADAQSRFLGFGAEINTMFSYTFLQHFGLNIGLHLGYSFNPFSGDPFYLGEQSAVTFFHTLNYGISFGMDF